MDERYAMVPLKQKWIKVKIIVDIVLWLAVGLSGFYLFLQADPYEQGFFCDDQNLSYPFKKDTVSTSLLITIGLIISGSIVVLVEVLNCIDGRCCRSCLTAETVAYCIKRYVVFLIGIAVQLLIVEVIKNMMGVLRPNFFDVCKPSYNTSLCPGYITEYKCTDTEHEVKELRNSRQSFPSGHSSFSMYIAVFFCLYIQRRLHITYSTLFKLILQMTLIVLSLLCGLGRVRDHKHHMSDIIVGYAIGIVVAIALYKIICENTLEENRNGMKPYLPSSDNPSIQCETCLSCDMCSSRDQLPEEDTLRPSPLLTSCDRHLGASNSLTACKTHSTNSFVTSTSDQYLV